MGYEMVSFDMDWCSIHGCRMEWMDLNGGYHVRSIQPWLWNCPTRYLTVLFLFFSCRTRVGYEEDLCAISPSALLLSKRSFCLFVRLSALHSIALRVCPTPKSFYTKGTHAFS